MEVKESVPVVDVIRQNGDYVDITIGNETLLDGVPRQRNDNGDGNLHAALAELAAVASAQVSEREQVRADIDDERVVEEAEQERARSAWRAVGIVALVAAIAATVVVIILTLPKQPHASSRQTTVSTASIATARALGNTAGSRLAATGETVTVAACLSAYAADAAASPLLLPAPGRRNLVQDGYVAACMSK